MFSCSGQSIRNLSFLSSSVKISFAFDEKRCFATIRGNLVFLELLLVIIFLTKTSKARVFGDFQIINEILKIFKNFLD